MKRNNIHHSATTMRTARRFTDVPAVVSNGREVQVELSCDAPHAEKVCVAGDFNHWRAGDTRLRRDETGTWKVKLSLEPGRYEYRFIVDTEWLDDPHAQVRVPNEFGSCNCVLVVTS